MWLDLLSCLHVLSTVPWNDGGALSLGNEMSVFVWATFMFFYGAAGVQ